MPVTDPLAALAAPASTRGVVVVTGGSAGLGRATVRLFAEAGYDVAVLARGRDALAATVAEVAAAGRRGLGVVTDVADHAQVDAAAVAVEAALGPIEVWVNNAMAGIFDEFLAVEPADYERATMVNYLGFVNGTRAALRLMTARDRGTVIQVGSALAFRGIPLQSAYCGAKHAVVGFTESIIAELHHNDSNVHLAMVHMPALNTPQFNWVKNGLPDHPQPVAPIYQPEVGARAILGVAEHPKRSTWVGIPTVGTVLGNRFFAPLLDRYLGRTGYDGQQAPDLAEPMVGVNLHDPVHGDQGAHGAFDDQAHDDSLELRVSQAYGTVMHLTSETLTRVGRLFR